VKADRRDAESVDPPYRHPEYRSTLLRAPERPLLRIPYGPTELGGPDPAIVAAARREADGRAGGDAADLTRQHAGEPIGERIVVHGRVLDSWDRPVPGALVEIWQANAAGRYAHAVDQHPAPLDPNFTGAGWCLADGQGRFRFVTIKPGAYPWNNHPNAWRPAHIHVSVLGRTFAQRLVTQMYFPGDPLLGHDPIHGSIPNGGDGDGDGDGDGGGGGTARDGVVARFDPEATVPEWALAYRFDVRLGGRDGRDGPDGGAA
jgi:protocatechuate 3,4-dioxygenase beta subunit